MSSGVSLASGVSEGSWLVIGSSLGSVWFWVPQALRSARHIAMQSVAAMIFFIFHLLLASISAGLPPWPYDSIAAKMFPGKF